MKVSVIIPTYNRGHIIEKALKSVMDQTMTDLEILLCDDGSTDDSLEIIRRIDDCRIRWIAGDHGGRPAIPRNRGIAAAQGEWLAFLDSDDEWLPDKLVRQLERARQHNVTAVSTNAFRFIPGQGVVGTYLCLEKSMITFDDLLKSNEIITSSAIIRRSLIPSVMGFPEEEDMAVVEDYAFWLRVATQTDFAFLPEPLVVYNDDALHSHRATGITDIGEQRKRVFRNFVLWGAADKKAESFVARADKLYEGEIEKKMSGSALLEVERLQGELKTAKDEFRRVNRELLAAREALEGTRRQLSFRLGYGLLHPWKLLSRPSRACPEVTVLMPVYNGEKYLDEAIRSILGQTYGNFEFLIINDGSTDKSRELIAAYDDERIRYVENEQNLGLIATLNRGLALASGKYIARMDCDDVSLPERLERQVAFMEEHFRAGLCGTWIRFFGDAPPVVVKNPEDHHDIQCRLLFMNPVAHPTVMLRKDFLDRYELGYQEHSMAEDFDLWQRCSTLCPIHNIPEVLLNYRITPGSETHRNREVLYRTVSGLFRRQLKLMGVNADDDEIRLHKKIGDQSTFEDISEIEKARAYLVKLQKANHQHRIYPVRPFDRLIAGYWLAICTSYPGNYTDVFRIHCSAPFQKRMAAWYYLLRFYYRSLRAFAGAIVSKGRRLLSKMKKGITH